MYGQVLAHADVGKRRSAVVSHDRNCPDACRTSVQPHGSLLLNQQLAQPTLGPNANFRSVKLGAAAQGKASANLPEPQVSIGQAAEMLNVSESSGMANKRNPYPRGRVFG